jgi:hypothetical protein
MTTSIPDPRPPSASQSQEVSRTSPRQPEPSEERPLTPDLLDALRYHLNGRTGLLVLGAGVAALGLTFSWSWLVAVGLAPLLLAVLPCAAMCALALCANRAGGRSCASEQAQAETPPPARSVHTLEASESAPALPEGQRAQTTDPAPRLEAAEPSLTNLERKPKDERNG